MKSSTVLAALLSLFFISKAFAVSDIENKVAAEKMVQSGIALAKSKGLDEAIAETNKGKFKQGELYLIIYDSNGKCLAHSTTSSRVGQNMMNDKDPDGVLFIQGTD